jgi:hypothetical protein
MRKHSFFNRDGVEVSAAEATHNNVLKSGYSMRVPTQMRDGRALFDSGQVVVSDLDLTVSSGNRPGWRCADTADGQMQKDRARQEGIRAMCDAWRGDAASSQVIADPTCPDCGGKGEIGGKECRRCQGEGEIEDLADGSKTKRYNQRGQEEGVWGTETEPDKASDHRTLTADAWQVRRDAAVAPVRDAWIAEITDGWRANK